jgi:hypothetical protein
MTKLKKLTFEQELLLSKYRDKWQKVAVSTRAINRKQVTQTVRDAYNLISRQQPEIIFFKSPLAMIKQISW